MPSNFVKGCVLTNPRSTAPRSFAKQASGSHSESQRRSTAPHLSRTPLDKERVDRPYNGALCRGPFVPLRRDRRGLFALLDVRSSLRPWRFPALEADGPDAGDWVGIRFVPVSRGQTQMRSSPTPSACSPLCWEVRSSRSVDTRAAQVVRSSPSDEAERRCLSSSPL